MNILLTGGAGYIGSHVAVALSDAGHTVILLDNFSNSSPRVLTGLEKILCSRLKCIEGDVNDIALVKSVLHHHKVDVVIHLAGSKAVGESTGFPMSYYLNNVYGTMCLIEAMDAVGLKKLLFSSSATVYGEPVYLPLDENHPKTPTNPYGRTKLHIEEMLSDLKLSDPEWHIICLRYFNPVGAHDSGLIGDNPMGVPNNLFPFITQVAVGGLNRLQIFGGDYATPDGTGIRDYIHVVDLADGHLAAVNFLMSHPDFEGINLGTGHGYSVLEIIRAFEESTGIAIPHEIISRRLGDVAACYSSAKKAASKLDWVAQRSLHDMCKSAYKWQLYQGNS